MLWPDVWKGVRFLLPVVPLLTILIIHALNFFLEKILAQVRMPSTYSSYAAFLFLPFIFLFNQKYIPNEDKNWHSYPSTRLVIEAQGQYPSMWRNYIEVAKYAKKNLKDVDIVACRKPQLFHIFSERFTYMYSFTEDDKKLLQDLRDKNVRYVVVDQLGYSSTSKYLAPAINKNPKHFKVILHLKNPDTYLVQFFP